MNKNRADSAQHLVLTGKKRSSKRPKECKKQETSCMWGLINIFDFRQVHPTKKLLSNGRHVNNNKHFIGRGDLKSRLNLLTGADERGRSRKDVAGNKTLQTDAGKMVKTLLEEEISSAPSARKQVNIREVDVLDNLTEASTKTSKNRQRINQLADRKWKEATNMRHHKISHPSDEKVPSDKLNLSAMLVALYNQLHQNGITSEECNEINLDLSEKVLDIKTLNSNNKELFLKLLRDPNSLLAEHFQKLQDLQAEGENSKSSQQAKFPDFEEAVTVMKFQKQNMYNVLWNTIKTRYGYPSDGNENRGSPSNRIVVLKPGPRSMESSENVTCHCSSLHSSHSLKSKSNSMKPTYFSFRDIKRNLKFTNGEGEKEHQKTMKSSSDDKRRDKRAQPAESKSGIKPESNKTICKDISSTVSYPNRRDFDIYLEAKRHLSERLSNIGQSEAFSSREAPKTLGRILSLRHQDFSPSLSPKQGTEHDFDTAQMRFSPYDKDPPSSCADNSRPSDQLQEIDEKPNISENHLLNGYMKSVQRNNLTQPGELDILEEPSTPSSSHIIHAKESPDTPNICGQLVCSIPGSPPQNQKLTSSINVPSSSFLSIHRSGTGESTKDRTEYSSPVSVLEPFVAEDLASSPSTIMSPVDEISCTPTVELPIQPLHFDFEEHSYVESSPDPKTKCETCMDEKEFSSKFIEALHQAGCLNWDKLFLRWNSSKQLLIPHLFDQVDFPPTRSSCDHKLLSSIIDEVALEVYECCHSCSSYLSFLEPKTWEVRAGDNMVNQIKKGVDRCLHPPTRPNSLELLTGADLARSGMWIDLRHETEEIVIEMVDSILDELIPETVL